MKPRLRLLSGKPKPKSDEPLLKVCGVRKLFPSGGDYRRVLEDMEFSARSGELICILGRSGCGKTTLLKILAGFTPPSAGSVSVNGRPVTTPGPDRGVVFQEDALFPWLTVRENIAFGLRHKMPRGKVKTEVDRFLDLVGLSEFGDYLPKEISGGMKQRVALARVLILKPQVLLMDEPFAALDAQSREEMQNLLLSLWKTLSHTILFVTHDVSEAVTLADRILLMEKAPGRIREDIRVDLPRPRKTDTDRFLFFCRQLYEGLKD